MSFFKPNIAADAVQEGTGGGAKYINKSGIYDVTLKIVSVDINDKGARSINFNVEDPDNNPTTFYGLKLDNNDGSKNFGADVFNRLVIIADLENVNDPEEQEHKLGKDNKPTTLAVLDDFTDFECKIRVQEEYSKWQGEIKKRMVVKTFYRADGASAAEIVDEASGKEIEIGLQMSKDKAYAENVTYRDDLTPEEVQAWKDSFKKGGDAKPAASAPKTNKPAGSLFKR